MQTSRRGALKLMGLAPVGLSGCLGAIRDPAIEGEWPMFRYNTDRTGTNRDVRVPVDDTTIQWDVEMGATWGSPVVKDGKVVIGSYDGIYAVDATSGAVQWVYEIDERMDASPVINDQRVYFGGFDHNLYAVDLASGEDEWVFETEGIVRSSPAIADDILYVGGNCDVLECEQYYDVFHPARGQVYAIDATTGEEQWEYETDAGVVSSPAVHGDTLYMASTDGLLHAVDITTAEQRWTYQAGGITVGTPAIADGTVYLGSWDAELHAVDAGTGEAAWRKQTDAVYISSSPAIDGDTLYIGIAAVPPEGVDPEELVATGCADCSGVVLAVSRETGETKWTYETNAIEVGSSPAVGDNAVVVGAHTSDASAPGGIYALDKETGDRIWRHGVDGVGIGSSPAIVDETVFIGDVEGGLLAIR